MDLREIVQKELKRRGWSYYRLAREIKETVPPTTLYEWLGGKSETINSGHLADILAALDMTVTVKLKALQRKGR
ncbi:MAG TPA: helix-turn-helix transcriptional regulator [Tepidisphaeraceae bacterium]|nr:helix-turn-helix transcriptional regulator [Tepidisphaeraceae bacterium]